MVLFISFCFSTAFSQQSLTIGSGQIFIGMTRNEVINEYKNSITTEINFQKEKNIDVVTFFNKSENHEYIGTAQFDNDKVINICKEWLIEAELDRDIKHIFNMLFGLLEKNKDELKHCSISLNAAVDPKFNLKDITIILSKQKSLSLQIVNENIVNISECIEEIIR